VRERVHANVSASRMLGRNNIYNFFHILLLVISFLTTHLSLSRPRPEVSLSRSKRYRSRSLSLSSRPECLMLTSGPPLRVPPKPPPSLRGSQPFTVLARSTSTNTLRPSIFLPSACLYAAKIYRLEITVR